MMAAVIANGKETDVNFPTVNEFLQQLDLPPRSVVVEPNGEALTPSSFTEQQLSRRCWRSYELSPAVKVFCPVNIAACKTSVSLESKHCGGNHGGHNPHLSGRV